MIPISIPIPARAVAAQTPARFLAKTLVSAAIVGAAGWAGRAGTALALLVIFSGVTAPALRMVTLRMSGVLDRITVSPVHKPSAALFFTAAWSVVVAAGLAPATGIAIFLLGLPLLVPLAMGIILAVTIGTLAGIAARSLADAHLYALLAGVPLVIATLTPDVRALAVPYASLSGEAVSPGVFLVQIGVLSVCLAILAGVAAGK